MQHVRRICRVIENQDLCIGQLDINDPARVTVEEIASIDAFKILSSCADRCED
jgi:hypothetical protein